MYSEYPVNLLNRTGENEKQDPNPGLAPEFKNICQKAHNLVCFQSFVATLLISLDSAKQNLSEQCISSP